MIKANIFALFISRRYKVEPNSVDGVEKLLHNAVVDVTKGSREDVDDVNQPDDDVVNDDADRDLIKTKDDVDDDVDDNEVVDVISNGMRTPSPPSDLQHPLKARLTTSTPPQLPPSSPPNAASLIVKNAKPFPIGGMKMNEAKQPQHDYSKMSMTPLPNVDRLEEGRREASPVGETTFVGM